MRKRASRGAQAGVAALSVLLAGACSGGGVLGFGLGSDDGKSTPPRAWLCSEAAPGESCSCFAFAKGDSAGASNEVSRCEDYSCCYVTGTGNSAKCDCLQSASCQTEIGSRQGATAVSQCPPPAEQAPIKCAKSGENCRASYLSEQGLEGCCDGLACKPTAEGIPLCQPATKEEIATGKQCARGAYSGTTSVAVTDTVEAASGPVSVHTIYVGLLGATEGPGGCLASVVVTLGLCDLALGPSRDANGAYVVTNRSSCDSDGLGKTITGTATFNGLSCEGGALGPCYAGTFEFNLTSYDTDLFSGARTQILTGTPFHIGGTFCPSAHSAPSCTG